MDYGIRSVDALFGSPNGSIRQDEYDRLAGQSTFTFTILVLPRKPETNISFACAMSDGMSFA
jgi:hypothetical protein